ncbi:hypothetical protein VDR86_04145, partial [Xanthomonas campestris pv. campestris]|uniref:hypothetical protein n=1 Tax=Xanthomonas campestris TaxID=339 RepID=UPI0025A004A5
TSVAWITPQHQAGSVAYLWCVVQRFPKSDIAPDIRTDDLYILKGGYLVISDGKSVSQYRRCQ